MENRYCVIMCGGVGSRFWPFSKSSAPKQFIDFFGTGRSLLQMSFDRVAELVPVRNILAITNERYAPLVKQQLPDLADDQILLEPDRRNTAPCIAWAAYHIRAINPNAMMLVTTPPPTTGDSQKTQSATAWSKASTACRANAADC